MALRITDTCPAPSLPRRLARRVLYPLGVLLVLAGLVGAAPGLLSLVLLLPNILLAPTPPDPDVLNALLLLTGLALLSLFLGIELMRGRRRLVLFLRRFGFDDSSQALTRAVETAVGRRWRVVTLDDARMAPVGVQRTVRRTVRRTLRWGRWLGCLALVAAFVSACLWALGPGPDALVADVFNREVERAAGQGTNEIVAWLGASCLAGFGIFAVFLIFFVMLVGVAFVGGATLLTWGSNRMAAKAERLKTDEIRDAAQVEAFSRRVTRRSRLLFAPGLVVVRVATSQWRRAVRVLAASAAVILIDVSDPTENLLWEIETLEREVEAPWVLVGRRDRLETLARGGDGEVGRSLARRLDGDQALAYQGEDRRSMKRFAVALRNRLDQVARRSAR